MSSEPRRLRWWHWLLLAIVVLVLLVYAGTYSLRPAAFWAAG
jgi:Sec-independent protein translocase protein TatA